MSTNLELCPLCGTELSQTKYREIREKLRADKERQTNDLEEAKAAISKKLEADMKERFDRQRVLSEKKIRDDATQEIQKAVNERDRVMGKLKASDARESEIRKQAQAEIEKRSEAAEKRARLEAKAESASEMKKILAERDGAKEDLAEAKRREAQVRLQAQAQAEQELQKQLVEQRQIMDKDKSMALLKQQSEFNRDRDSMQKKVKTLEHQLAKKTAGELGDGGEIDVFEALRDQFQGDRITRIQKGQPGADILHEVLYKGECCGRIVTDSKNRQAWQNVFVSKLRQDKVEANAEHAILATTVFPAGKKELCIESGVIIVSPARVIYVTELLRQSMVSMHVKGLGLNERSNKMSQLYDLITSEAYMRKLGEVERLAQDVLDLDVQEQKDHGNVWRRRGTITTRLKNLLREVDTDVAAIIEAAEGLPPEPSTVKAQSATA